MGEKVAYAVGGARVALLGWGLAAWMLCVPAAARAYEVDFWSHTTFRHETDEREADSDAATYLDFRAQRLWAGRLDLVLTGWANANLREDGFESSDTYARLSQAYVQLRPADGGFWARLGRFYVDQVDSLRLDGGLAGLGGGGTVEALLFAGAPVSYYSSTKGELAGGMAVSYSPDWRTTLRADAYALREANETWLASALRLNRSVEFLNGRAATRLRFLDHELRDLYANVVSYAAPAQTTLNLHYYLQPRDRGQGAESLTRDFSHLGRMFGASYSHHRFGASAQAFLGERWLLLAGATVKRLLDEPDTDYAWANVDSTVLNAGLSWMDGLADGVTVSLLGNWVDNENDYFFDITGEVEYAFGPTLTAAVGLTYSGYHFAWPAYPDMLNDQEPAYALDDHIGSRIGYLELDWRPAKEHRVRLSAAYEAMDGYDDAWLFQLGYQVRFSWRGEESP